MKAVITGANGFIGWHLAAAFRDAGWEVVGLVRTGREAGLPSGISAGRWSLDPDRLASEVRGASVIVHAAGVAHARSAGAFGAINVGGTEAAVRAANATGARFLLVSSQAAAGSGTPECPSRESDEPKPLTAYGRSKAIAEGVVRTRATVPWTIIRPSSIYGPRDRQFLPLFRMAARGFFPRAARASLALTLMHVDDLSHAIVLAAGGAADGETLFLGHPDVVTTDGLFRAIAAAVNRRYRPIPVPAAVMNGLAWAGDIAWSLGRQPLLDSARLVELRADGFVCAVDRAREVLGVTPSVELQEGIRRTAAWYRREQWL